MPIQADVLHGLRLAFADGLGRRRCPHITFNTVAVLDRGARPPVPHDGHADVDSGAQRLLWWSVHALFVSGRPSG